MSKRFNKQLFRVVTNENRVSIQVYNILNSSAYLHDVEIVDPPTGERIKRRIANYQVGTSYFRSLEQAVEAFIQKCNHQKRQCEQTISKLDRQCYDVYTMQDQYDADVQAKKVTDE